MQVNHTHTNTVIPSRFPWYLSIALAVIVALTSSALGGYNLYLDMQIRDTNAAIAEVDKNIALMSTDTRIIITKILRSNAIRPSLDIGGLITQFKGVADRANVRLKGFAVANDVISTTLIANEGDPQIHPDPASTIIKMMREYANGQKYFSLDPITALSGNPSERSTAIELKVIGKKY